MNHDELLQVINKRYSCRSYTSQKIEGQVLSELESAIQEANEKSNLHIQLVLDDGKAFAGLRKSYGMFRGVSNYITMVGTEKESLQEKVGYYGEALVLKAAALGLGTCWVGGTYSKKDCTCQVADGEVICCVITIGYPATETTFIGRLAAKKNAKRKPIEEMCSVDGEMPDWFRRAMEAVQKAPSAVNAQPVSFQLLADNKVRATTKQGVYTRIDLGIAKLHFEIGAGGADWKWEEKERNQP